MIRSSASRRTGRLPRGLPSWPAGTTRRPAGFPSRSVVAASVRYAWPLRSSLPRASCRRAGDNFFLADHLRRLATPIVQVHRRLEAPQVEFAVPTTPVRVRQFLLRNRAIGHGADKNGLFSASAQAIRKVTFEIVATSATMTLHSTIRATSRKGCLCRASAHSWVFLAI